MLERETSTPFTLFYQLMFLKKQKLAFMEWTHSKALELIECYRKHTVLWDNKSIGYKISVKKFEAWAEIAHMLNTDIYEVRRKMQSILASFRRERHKLNSKWFGVDHLQFLLDIPITPRTKIRRSLISSENDGPMIYNDESSENNKIYDTNDNEMDDLSENDNNQSVLIIVDSDDENECRQLEEQLEEEEEAMQIEPMIEQPNNLTLMDDNLNEDPLLSQSPTQSPTSRSLLSPSSSQIPQIVSVKSLNEKAITTSNTTNTTITSSVVATTTTNNTTSNTKSTSTTSTNTVTCNTISATPSNVKECKFINNVINKLRNYDSNTRAIVQHLLNNILFEAEMDKYNNAKFNPTTFLDESIKDIEPKLCYDSKEQFVTAILSGTINADISQQPQQQQQQQQQQ